MCGLLRLFPHSMLKFCLDWILLQISFVGNVIILAVSQCMGHQVIPEISISVSLSICHHMFSKTSLLRWCYYLRCDKIDKDYSFITERLQWFLLSTWLLMGLWIKTSQDGRTQMQSQSQMYSSIHLSHLDYRNNGSSYLKHLLPYLPHNIGHALS